MEEARFADHKILRGLNDKALWNLTCISGGCRPRTYASILLKHLLPRRVEAIADDVGCTVLVPSFGIEFEDEKYMDKCGPRQVRESFFGWIDVWQHAGLTAYCELSSMLLYCGCFDGWQSFAFVFDNGVQDCYVVMRSLRDPTIPPVNRYLAIMQKTCRYGSITHVQQTTILRLVCRLFVFPEGQATAIATC